jgi:hypothetical protein
MNGYMTYMAMMLKLKWEWEWLALFRERHPEHHIIVANSCTIINH